MTRRERVEAFLQERGHEGATNREIADSTGLPHTLVFNITQHMMARGHVRGRRLSDGIVWHFVWRGAA